MNLFIGAHVSISGGLRNACIHAEATGSTVIQIFTRNQVQWKSKEPDSNDVDLFKKCIAPEGLKVASHLSYLVNLGSTDNVIAQNSILAFIDEVKRCSLLNINLLVFHPGSNKNLSEDETINEVAKNLNKIIKNTQDFKEVGIILETTAGQGNQIGYKLEHIAEIIKSVEDGQRLGVCIDTCHIFAAGYDIRTLNGYNRFIDDFDRIIGLNLLKVVHLNDSLKPLGSRVDRHASIGKGHIGLDAFGFIVNDERLKNALFIVETPGDDNEHKKDIDILRGLQTDIFRL